MEAEGAAEEVVAGGNSHAGITLVATALEETRAGTFMTVEAAGVANHQARAVGLVACSQESKVKWVAVWDGARAVEERAIGATTPMGKVADPRREARGKREGAPRFADFSSKVAAVTAINASTNIPGRPQTISSW